MRRAAQAAARVARAAVAAPAREALCELRLAAGRSDARYYSAAARYSCAAVARATPVALFELARSAALQARCQAQPPAPQRTAAAAAALARPRRPLAAALCAGGEALLTLVRALQLALLFAPLLASAPLCLLYDLGREQWLHALNQTLRVAGPAFIKWGQARCAARLLAALTPPQWAATRSDLFPPDMCDILTSLQSDAPCHSWAHTRREVEAAFGQPLEARAPPPRSADAHARSAEQALFASFEQLPVASGSIAQVHRAVLASPPAPLLPRRCRAAQSQVVAVKVRHPGVATIINRDFTILRVLAELAGTLPGLGWMRLDESVRQFREPLFEQVDLTREASNLRAFNANFAAWRRVSFPVPVEGLVRPAVLVESFEEGISIREYLQADDPELRRSLADLGCKMLLKMMLADNFVHADLHPGNILVRMEAEPRPLLARLLHPRPMPHLVLLDCGMTASLSERNKENLRAFFTAITKGDGRGVAESALSFSERQTCPQPQAFVDDMVSLFSTALAWGFDVNTSEWMGAVMESVRRHQVHLASEVCSVVVTALVLEGWSNRLDPSICIMHMLSSLLYGGERLQMRFEELAKLL